MPRAHDRERLKRFGEFIKSKRDERGLTQTQVGEALGVTANHIATLEAGKCAPGFESTIGLLRVLNIRPDEVASIPVNVPRSLAKRLPPSERDWAGDNLAFVRIVHDGADRGLTVDKLRKAIELLVEK